MEQPAQVKLQSGRLGGALRRGWRIGYFLVAWVFVGFVLIQVFLAGLSVFVGPLN